jgi:probable molybdopterin-guanine dinucleotide biosynthesis protein A
MQTDISELENGQLAEQQLPSDFTLVVLAGGASSHMGREKSDLLLDGQTFLEIQIGKGCQLGAKQILISGYRGTQ